LLGEILLTFAVLYGSVIVTLLLLVLGRTVKLGRFEDWASIFVIGLGAIASGYFWLLLSSDARMHGRPFISFFAINLTLSCAISFMIYSAGVWFRKRAANTKEV
jgi:hypothetical protein